MQRKFIKRTDAILLIGLGGIALIIWAFTQRTVKNTSNAYAEVLFNEAVIERLPLDSNKLYTLPQNEQVKLEVQGGSCGFIHSDCPDKVCINTGFLNKSGQSAACLPNKVAVRIVVDTSNEDMDTIVH